MADVHQVAYQDKFTSIPLDTSRVEGKNGKVKVPKRVLHFSDGVLEEYSSDEEDCTDAMPTTVVDPKSLNWIPWCRHYVTTAAKMSLSMAELCGEKLAWLFGITAPKYSYAIEEYKAISKQAAEEKEQELKLQEQAKANSSFDVKVLSEDKKVTSAPKEDAENKY